jgi:translation initiation factor 2B subunit (eIF-2B alpha/beta/delta family)
MTGLAMLETVIFLLQAVAQATPGQADENLIAIIQRVIRELKSVHDTDVTFEQLQKMRVEVPF